MTVLRSLRLCSFLLALPLLLPQNLPAADVSNLAGYSRTDKPEDWVVTSTKGWMGALKGSLKLSQLSIPGTHDSCALYGGDLVECQSWTIPEQLSAGVRYLDIRCRPIENVFTIHHGQVYQKINFGTVMNQCIAFLKENPTECIIMSIKDEHRDKSVTQDQFSAIFEKYRSKEPNFWYTSNRIPTLDQAKGKIVLIKRYGNDAMGGIGWGSSKLSIHDDWEVPTLFAIPAHRDGIERHLKLAADYSSGSKWYLTHTNGSSGGAYPVAVARRTNDYVLGWVQDYGKKCLGTIVMDYPSEQMIDAIIRSNFSPANLKSSSSATASTPSASYTLTIIQVLCNQSSEAGEDEVFFTISNGTRIPASGSHSMNEGDPGKFIWMLNKKITFSGPSIRVTMIEDDPKNDDNLGSFTVPAKEGNGTAKLTGDGGEYLVTWYVTKN